MGWLAWERLFNIYSFFNKYLLTKLGLYTYDIPVPGPHIGSGKTPPKKQEIKKHSQEKREETLRRATEERISLQDGQKQ